MDKIKNKQEIYTKVELTGTEEAINKTLEAFKKEGIEYKEI